jgi:hypothetical protein
MVWRRLLDLRKHPSMVPVLRDDADQLGRSHALASGATHDLAIESRRRPAFQVRQHLKNARGVGLNEIAGRNDACTVSVDRSPITSRVRDPENQVRPPPPALWARCLNAGGELFYIVARSGFRSPRRRRATALASITKLYSHRQQKRIAKANEFDERRGHQFIRGRISPPILGKTVGLLVFFAAGMTGLWYIMTNVVSW